MTTYDCYVSVRLLPRGLARRVGRWAGARAIGDRWWVVLLCGGETLLWPWLAYILSHLPRRWFCVGWWSQGVSGDYIKGEVR